jgi:hypothetical protein
MAITIPRLQSVEALSRHFNVLSADVSVIIECLASIGLARMEMGRVEPGIAHVYVGADSSFASHHHMIWRAKAMQSGQPVNSEDLQYSLCFTVSKKDWSVVRETMVRAIEGCLTVIRPSEAEKLGMICVDLRPL